MLHDRGTKARHATISSGTADELLALSNALIEQEKAPDPVASAIARFERGCARRAFLALSMAPTTDAAFEKGLDAVAAHVDPETIAPDVADPFLAAVRKAASAPAEADGDATSCDPELPEAPDPAEALTRLRERDPRIADLLDRGWATNGYRAGWLRQRRDARLAEESGLTALLARLDADETGADEAAAARQPASDIDPDDDAVRDAKRALARQAAKEIWHGTRENPTADALLSLFPQAADAVAAVGNLPCSDFLRSLERTKAEAWATLVHGMRDEDREAASARIASAGDPQAFVKAVSAAINAGR